MGQARRYPEHESRHPWLAKLLDAYDLCDEAARADIARESARRGAPPACKGGCHVCCVGQVVPVSADYLAVQGAKEVERALNALEPVFKQRLPRRYVITRFDMRRRMSAEVVQEMARSFQREEVCITRIRENVKLAESPAEGLDVFRHAPDSRGARDYEELADELVGAGFLR